MKSKGIQTAIEILNAVKKKKPRAKLIVAGRIDNKNPDSISKKKLKELYENKDIEYLDYVENMKEVYLKCDILLFPSTYREGVPRSILEAMSFGLTIITTDMPGCNTTVCKNGILLKQNYVEEATSYINSLSNKDLINNSKNSIKIFKENFSNEIIFPKYFERFPHKKKQKKKTPTQTKKLQKTR